MRTVLEALGRARTMSRREGGVRGL